MKLNDSQNNMKFETTIYFSLTTDNDERIISSGCEVDVLDGQHFSQCREYSV